MQKKTLCGSNSMWLKRLHSIYAKLCMLDDILCCANSVTKLSPNVSYGLLLVTSVPNNVCWSQFAPHKGIWASNNVFSVIRFPHFLKRLCNRCSEKKLVTKYLKLFWTHCPFGANLRTIFVKQPFSPYPKKCSQIILVLRGSTYGAIYIEQVMNK